MSCSNVVSAIFCGLVVTALAIGTVGSAEAETADSFLANKRSREHQPQFKPITRLKIKPAPSCPRVKCESGKLITCGRSYYGGGACRCRPNGRSC